MFSTLFPLEALILVIALSIDAFVASFAYGTNKIRIPFLSTIIISAICSGILALSLIIGSVLSDFINANITIAIGFVIMFLLGIIKLFDSSIKTLIRKNKNFKKEYKFTLFSLNFILNVYADPEKADMDRSRLLSPVEAVSLAIALSLDGAIAGFGAGLLSGSIIQTVLFSFVIGACFIIAGYRLGNHISKKLSFDMSWISGILLILLAFLKLL